MNSKLFILIVILLNINSLTAQEEFPLWENGIPSQIVSSEVEEYASGGNQPDDVLRIHQVDCPKLKAYPAPKEKSNGAAVLIALEEVIKYLLSIMKVIKLLNGSMVWVSRPLF